MFFFGIWSGSYLPPAPALINFTTFEANFCGEMGVVRVFELQTHLSRLFGCE